METIKKKRKKPFYNNNATAEEIIRKNEQIEKLKKEKELIKDNEKNAHRIHAINDIIAEEKNISLFNQLDN